MQRSIALTVMFALAAFGCGQRAEDQTTQSAEGSMPADAAHQGQDVPNPHGAMDMSALHQPMGVNAEVSLPDDITSAWSAVKIRVADTQAGSVEEYVVPIGDSMPLGESGLVIVPEVFVPAFVMGPDGITSRSAAPTNPAVRVRISEDGVEDYEGWLFGAMPEIHPFPHDRYQVMLVEGVPAT